MALSTKFHLWHIVAVTFIGGGNWSHWQIWSQKLFQTHLDMDQNQSYSFSRVAQRLLR